MSDKDLFLDKYRVNISFNDDEYINFSKSKSVIVLEDEIAEIILFILKTNKINSLVEIGSGTGYSAKLFSTVIDSKNIVSVESDYERYKLAKEYNKDNDIEFKNLEGSEYLKNRKEKIDLLFLDASKSHYLEFLNSAEHLIKTNTIILADNIFARGITYDRNIKKRHRTIQNKMKLFLNEIFSEKYNTVLLDIGDGLVYAKRK